MAKLNLMRHFYLDGLLCHYCGIEIDASNASVDHVIPRSKGGTHHKSNLVMSCKSCNSVKHSKTIEEFRLRIAIKASKWSGILTTPQVQMLMADGHDLGIYPEKVVFHFEKGVKP